MRPWLANEFPYAQMKSPWDHPPVVFSLREGTEARRAVITTSRHCTCAARAQGNARASRYRRTHQYPQRVDPIGRPAIAGSMRATPTLLLLTATCAKAPGVAWCAAPTDRRRTVLQARSAAVLTSVQLGARSRSHPPLLQITEGAGRQCRWTASDFAWNAKAWPTGAARCVSSSTSTPDPALPAVEGGAEATQLSLALLFLRPAAGHAPAGCQLPAWLGQSKDFARAISPALGA